MHTFFRVLLASAATAVLSLPVGAALEWQPVGPDGGDLLLVSNAPSQPATIHAHSVLAAYRSDNGALDWQPVHDAEMGFGVVALAYDPFDASHIFVATGRNGVFESVDQGASWRACGAGLPAHPESQSRTYPVTSLAFSGDGGLYAGIGEIADVTLPDAWIYRSDDGCASWVADSNGITFAASALTQNIATLLSNAADGSLWAMVYGAGVYARNGAVWVNANGNLPADALRSTYLAHDPNDGAGLMLGTETTWIYHSTNGGQSWSQRSLPPSLGALPVLPPVYNIVIDPANSQVRYAMTIDAEQSNETAFFSADPLTQTAGGGGYLSTDGGISWNDHAWRLLRAVLDPATTTVAAWPPHAAVERSAEWYGTSFGAYNLLKSFDGGASFAVANDGIDAVVVNNVWAHPDPLPPGGRVTLVASESGLYLRRDAGPWARVKTTTTPIYSWSFAADYLAPDNILFATGNPARSASLARGVYRLALDCFDTECASEQILSDVGTWRVVTTPARPGYIYAATQEHGVLRSTDAGDSWNTFNVGLSLPQSVTDLLLDAAGNPRLASARTSNGNFDLVPPQRWQPTRDEAGTLFRHDGSAWIGVTQVTDAVYDLEVHPSDANTIYAATSNGLIRSSDGGTNWFTLVADTVINAVVTDPLDGNYVYAATANGILRSTDGGQQWHDFSNGLRLTNVLSLSVDAATGIVSAGTAGNSVYELSPALDPRPEIGAAPEDLVFATVALGFSETATFAIVNHGEAALTITAIGASHAAFSVSDPGLPVTLSPGNSIDLSVQFAPDAIGPIAAEIVISSNDPITPSLHYAVAGDGRAALEVVPDLRINGADGPVAAAFGATVNLEALLSVGDYIGVEADFWIRQTRPDGTRLWLVEGAGWVESSTPQRLFVAGLTDHPTPFLSAGLVSPISGAHTIELAVDDNRDNVFDATWSDQVEVNFALRPPTLLVTPTTLAFGDVATPVAGTRVLALVNQGETELTVTSLSMSNPLFDFVTPPALPLRIAAGASALLSARFSPVVAGPSSGTLTVQSDDPAQPSQVVALTGTGIEPVEVVPDARVNGLDDAVNVTRGEPVTLTTYLDGGDYSGVQADFWVRVTRPDLTTLWLVQGSGWIASATPLRFAAQPIHDAASPLLSVGVTTPQSGSYTASFFVDDNADGVFDATWSDTVSFGADATPPRILTSSPAMAFADTALGGATTAYVGIVNAGEQDLVLSAIDVGHRDFELSDAPTLPLTVRSGTPLILALRFAPLSVGDIFSQLTLHSNDPGESQLALQLQGVGYAVSTPQPYIRIDGSDDGLTIGAGESRAVTISLNPNDHLGEDADWWILQLKRNDITNAYEPTLIDAYQATLDPSTDTLVADTGGLTAGQYVYVFAVDLNANGRFDATDLHLDTVALTVE